VQDILRGLSKVGCTFLKDHTPPTEPDSSGRELTPWRQCRVVSKRSLFGRFDKSLTLGLYYAQMSDLVNAKDAIDPIISLALNTDIKRRTSNIHAIIACYNMVIEEDHPEAFKHFEEALKISEEINDTPAIFFANFWLGQLLSYNCEFQKASCHIEKTLEINVAANTLWAISATKSHLSFFAYFYPGRMSLAFQTSDEALGLGEESGDIFSKSIDYTFHGVSCFGKGLFEEAIGHLLKGIDYSERIDNFVYNAFAQQYLGETYFEIGEYQKSEDHYGKAICLLEPKKFQLSLRNLCQLGITRAKVLKNEKDVDLELLYRYEIANKVKSWEGLIQKYIGEILLNIDGQHVNEAKKWINKAIEADGKNGMRFNLGRDHVLCGELFKRKGDHSKAKENIVKAIEILTECGADGWVKRTEDKLAQL
jgi:tetratricopeptide (TPR) repeat protein